MTSQSVDSSLRAALPLVRLNEDERFFLEHRENLLAAYAGKYVAIRRGELIAAADTRRELEAGLEKALGRRGYAFVRQVTPEAFVFQPEEPFLGA